MIEEIKITVLRIDKGDDSIHFEIYFSNSSCASTLDFYGYANEFKEFGQKLTDFPKSVSDKVTYELGEKGDKWAYYLLIQAYCVEVNGQFTIKIESTNNGTGPSYHHNKFEINSEPASINLLGQGLKSWNPLESKEFKWNPN